jgi:hypothetical protein
VYDKWCVLHIITLIYQNFTDKNFNAHDYQRLFWRGCLFSWWRRWCFCPSWNIKQCYMFMQFYYFISITSKAIWREWKWNLKY